MTEPQEGGCCRCCVSFIFTSGLTALFLWLNLRVTSPTCSIEDFYAYALNKSVNPIPVPSKNHTITYHLKLRNNNKDKGVYYDALNLTFYYNNTPTYNFSYIGNNTVAPFYQGHQKKAHRYLSFEPAGVKWENATAGFRVELNTTVRYKIVFWATKRHRISEWADLQVNDNGSLVKRKKNKGIKLSSGVTKIRGSLGILGTTMLLGVLVFNIVIIPFW